MHFRKTTLLLLALAAAWSAAAAENFEAALNRALEAMAARQVHGGWAMAWTQDGRVTWGEYRPVSPGCITVQPPATPGVAQVYLRAAEVLGEPRWLDKAREARDALLALQTPAGGFPHEGDPTKGHATVGTFDDHVTTGALAFFLALWKTTQDPKDKAAVDSVGAFLLEAQYPSGGWPQRYPPPAKSYGRCITFNDNVMANVLRALFDLHEATGDHRYLEAALRGGDCIIALQGGPGEAAWAQQYDPDTLEPAWARDFEPPGYCTAESVGVCDILIELYLETGQARFLEPLPKAFAWFEAVALPNGKRARLYEPGTHRPVYGRRDKRVRVYDFAQACSGYGWQAPWFPTNAKAAYERIQAVGRDAYLAERAAKRPPEPKALRTRAQEAAQALSPQGEWLSNAPGERTRQELRELGLPEDAAIVHTHLFCGHAHALLDAIEAAAS